MEVDPLLNVTTPEGDAVLEGAEVAAALEAAEALAEHPATGGANPSPQVTPVKLATYPSQATHPGI